MLGEILLIIGIGGIVYIEGTLFPRAFPNLEDEDLPSVVELKLMAKEKPGDEKVKELVRQKRILGRYRLLEMASVGVCFVGIILLSLGLR